MFEAEYIDITLAKERSFGEIGRTDTLRVFEPTPSFIDKPHKDDDSRARGIRAKMKKNTFAVINGRVEELPPKVDLFECISVPEFNKIEQAFLKLMGVMPPNDKNDDSEDEDEHKNPK